MVKYIIASLLVVISFMSCSKKAVVEIPPEPVPKGEHIQGKPSEGKSMVEDREDQIVAKLGLDENTAAKFKAIEKEYREKRLALRDENIEQVAKLNKARTLMTDMDAEYKKLFSDEQYMAYKGIMNSKINGAPADQ